MEFKLREPGTDNWFHFPVNPEEVSIRREKQFETVNFLSLGEVDFSQGEKVKEISFSSFFPKYDLSNPARLAEMDPATAMNQLTTYLVRKQPLQLMITETGVNAFVYISNHDTTIRGGEPGDVYFDLTLRTWRDTKVRSKKASKGKARPDTKPVPKVYTVKFGDNLSSIAKRELGSSAKWKALYEKNKTVIGKDPNRILSGQKLVMP